MDAQNPYRIDGDGGHGRNLPDGSDGVSAQVTVVGDVEGCGGAGERLQGVERGGAQDVGGL